jgi:ankyrin repeat protein
MKACEKGNEDIMGKLLAQFTQKDILASLTAQNKDGNTCLMKACATGNLKVIKPHLP